MTKVIGVLALQGAFREHITILHSLGVSTCEVRLPADLDEIDALIIPGGESTTIGKLAVMYDLMTPLRTFAQSKPMWGTCAGMILMAKKIGQEQPLLGVMDIEVERNAFGRQVDSFETALTVSEIPSTQDDPFHAVFIRAPNLDSAADPAQIIATLADGTPIAAQQDHLLVTSFHPELTNDPRFHEYFLRLLPTT